MDLDPASAPAETAPVARIRVTRYASDRERRRRVKLRLSSSGRGSPVAGLRVQFRPAGDVAMRWRAVAGETRARFLFFRGQAGQTYQFRVRARDRLGNFSPFAYARSTFPLDDRSRRLRFGGGWLRSRDRGAYERSLRRAVRRGASLRLRYRGTRVALIAPRLVGGGFVRVTVGGRSRVVSLHGDGAARRVVFRSRALRPGVHRLTVVALGGGAVAVDAVAYEQGPGVPSR